MIKKRDEANKRVIYFDQAASIGLDINVGSITSFDDHLFIVFVHL